MWCPVILNLFLSLFNIYNVLEMVEFQDDSNLPTLHMCFFAILAFNRLENISDCLDGKKFKILRRTLEHILDFTVLYLYFMNEIYLAMAIVMVGLSVYCQIIEKYEKYEENTKNL